MRKRRVALFVALSIYACAEPARTTTQESPTETPRKLRLDSAATHAALVNGESAYARSEFDSARAAWSAALDGLAAGADPLVEARLKTWLGLAAYRTGDYAGARKYGEDALALKVRHRMKADLFKSYNALGLLAWNQGRLQEAVDLYKRASDAARQVSDEVSRAKAANNLGLVYAELGEFARAREGFEEARKFGNRTSDALMEGRALTNVAMLDIELGDPVSAVRHLGTARSLYQKAGDRTGEQNALGQLGWARNAMGDPGSALAILDSALAMSRSQKLRQEEASNLELIAAVQRKAGRLRSALSLYKRAQEIDRELDLVTEQGINLRQTAEIHAQLGRLDLARAEALRAVALHRSNASRVEELRDLLALAEIELARGAPRDSVELIVNDGSDIAATLNSRPARVDAAIARASIALRFGRSRHAIAIIGGARRDLERGNYYDRAASEAILAKAYTDLDVLDSAEHAGRRAVDALERVRQRFDSPLLRQSFIADHQAVHAQLVGVLLKLNRPDEAFEVADGVQSRALIENLSMATGVSDLSGAAGDLRSGDVILRRISHLIARLDAAEQESAGKGDPESKKRELGMIAELSSLRTAYEGIVTRVSRRSAADAMLLSQSGTDAGAVGSLLEREEALVEFLVTDDRLIVFVVTRSGVTPLVIDVSASELDRRVRLARETIGRASSLSGEGDAIMASLHKLIIGPIEKQSLFKDVRSLMLVTQGSLSYLPFGALRSGPRSRYLIEEYSIAQLPSASSLVAMRGSRKSPMNMRSHGGVVFTPFVSELPSSVQEAKAIRGQSNVWREVAGRAATERELREALTTDGVIHVATHGLMNPLNPLFSRIDLAKGTGEPSDDGRLEVYELLSMKTGATLVFLSGCETALGPAGSNRFATGDDYATLAQAFLFAGARAVAATIWRISDRGAAVFAKRFYAALADSNPVEALAITQRQMLRDAPYARPYYWAGYQVSAHQ